MQHRPIGAIEHPVTTTSSIPTYPTTYDVFQAAQDDISNQNLQAIGGIGGS